MLRGKYIVLIAYIRKYERLSFPLKKGKKKKKNYTQRRYKECNNKDRRRNHWNRKWTSRRETKKKKWKAGSVNKWNRPRLIKTQREKLPMSGMKDSTSLVDPPNKEISKSLLLLFYYFLF